MVSKPRNICGRCGYDLSGIVESWGTEHAHEDGAACPLAGTCSECGWEFDWCDIFNAWRLDQRWLIEHAESKRGALKRLIPTAWCVLRPRSFWGGLSMQARVRPWFAAIVLLAFLLPLHLAVGGYETARLIRADYAWNNQWGAAAAPLDFSSTRKVIAAAVAGPVIRPELVAQTNPNINPGATGWSVGSSSIRLHILTDSLPWWLVAGAAMVLAWVVLLALLPVTRAVSKLRWAHVARASVYSATALIVLFEIERLLLYSPWSGRHSQEWPVFFVFAGWLWLWWGSAVVSGWEMKHARAVALLLGLASVLAGLTAGVLFDPYLFSELL